MIPSVPFGTELRSYVSVLQYLHARRGNPFTRSCIIWRARKVSENMLNERSDPAQVLMKFTALSVVVGTLDEQASEGMLQKISSRDLDAEAAAIIKRLMPRHAPMYRRCPCCISEDLNEHGFAFGRTLHQIAAIYTCPKHNVILEDECPVCGAGFDPLPQSVPSRRELQVCDRCKSTKGRSLLHSNSGGYEAFVELLARGLEGCAPEVGPRLLRVALNRFAELTLEHDVDLLPMFAEFWAHKDWREACNKSGVNAHEIRGALMFGAAPRGVLSAYVLASFFHAEVARNHRLPSGRAARVPRWNFKSRFLRNAEIKCQAHEFGMPMHVVYLLFSGDWVAVRKLGYPIKEVRRFVATLKGWQQLALHARRTVFIGSRISRLNVNNGEVTRTPEVLVRGAKGCMATDRFKYLCELLEFPYEVEYGTDVPSGNPVVFVDGIEMNFERSYESYAFAIQRTQFWPQLQGLRFRFISHVPRPESP